MLKVTRRPGEAIRIDDEIVLRVVSVDAGRVTLGIEAPSWVSVDRGERETSQLETSGDPRRR